jgi:hypothetical protein
MDDTGERKMTNIVIVEIKVDVLPGADYPTVFQQMIDLAKQAECNVVFETPRGQQILATQWSTVTWMMKTYLGE